MVFIGDLSKKDAHNLKRYFTGKKVLEFGAGGSTMILSQCAESYETVETEKNWIDKTKQHIKDIAGKQPKKWINTINHKSKKKYDVIFVDGKNNLRLAFANNFKDNLKENGVMIFHDTRRAKDINTVNAFLRLNKEFTSVIWNVNRSNLTICIKDQNKKVYSALKGLEYENWNIVENKPKWMVNGDDKPENWIEKLDQI